MLKMPALCVEAELQEFDLKSPERGCRGSRSHGSQMPSSTGLSQAPNATHSKTSVSASVEFVTFLTAPAESAW